MKAKSLLIVITTTCLLFGCTTTAATKSALPQRFILTNVKIVDVESQKIHPSMQIAVSDGQIIRVEPAQAQVDKPGVTIIDGHGGYVTPGLIDMHVHLYDKGALSIALSHGVTHVRIMNGIPAQLVWRDQVQDGELIGSTATVSSPIISAYEDAYLHRTALTEDEVRSAVREFHLQGYDLIKAYGNLSEQVLEALVEESRTLGIPVAKHGPHASGNMPVSALTGFQSFEHIEDIYQGPLNYQQSSELLPPIIEEIKATKVPLTPTLNIYHQLTQLSLDKQAFLDTVPQDYTSPIIALEARSNQVQRWLEASDSMAEHNQKTLVFLQELTRHFQAGGVKLLVGSDSGVLLSPHGLATHNEMRLMAEAGLSPFEVLAAATVNPALALGLDTEIGRIKPNYIADFLYTTTSPIDDLSALKQPAAVVKNGHWYWAEDLIQLRTEAIESRSIWAELTALFEAL